MAGALDKGWAEAVCLVCDPIFESANVGFVRQVQSSPGSRHVTDLLWEADPRRFAQRYPDSRIIDSYGPDWPPPCIDYWVYLDGDSHQARLSVEGWSLDDETIDLSGSGELDGIRIGHSVARILRVPGPRQ
jgi:hypothetical protein